MNTYYAYIHTHIHIPTHTQAILWAFRRRGLYWLLGVIKVSKKNKADHFNNHARISNHIVHLYIHRRYLWRYACAPTYVAWHTRICIPMYLLMPWKSHSAEVLAKTSLLALPVSDDGGTGAVWIFYRDTDSYKPRPGDKLVGPSSLGKAFQGLLCYCSY